MSGTIELITGDARSLKIQSSSIDLIVTQLPFYKLDFFNYGGEPKKQIGSEKNIKGYINSLSLAMKEMERVLKPTGSIIASLPNEFETASNYVAKTLKKTNLLLANPPFIWNFLDKEAPPVFGSVSFRYDLIFHFIKSPKLIYSNPYKVNSYSDGIWDVPWNGEDKVLEKINTLGFAENSFRSEIPKRFIEMFSRPGQTVLDPFGGSGTTACEAYRLGRNGISVDISEEQTDLAKIRLDIIKDDVK